MLYKRVKDSEIRPWKRSSKVSLTLSYSSNSSISLHLCRVSSLNIIIIFSRLKKLSSEMQRPYILYKMNLLYKSYIRKFTISIFILKLFSISCSIIIVLISISNYIETCSIFQHLYVNFSSLEFVYPVINGIFFIIIASINKIFLICIFKKIIFHHLQNHSFLYRQQHRVGHMLYLITSLHCRETDQHDLVDRLGRQ